MAHAHKKARYESSAGVGEISQRVAARPSTPVQKAAGPCPPAHKAAGPCTLPTTGLASRAVGAEPGHVPPRGLWGGRQLPLDVEVHVFEWLCVAELVRLQHTARWAGLAVQQVVAHLPKAAFAGPNGLGPCAPSGPASAARYRAHLPYAHLREIKVTGGRLLPCAQARLADLILRNRRSLVTLDAGPEFGSRALFGNLLRRCRALKKVSNYRYTGYLRPGDCPRLKVVDAAGAWCWEEMRDAGLELHDVGKHSVDSYQRLSLLLAHPLRLVDWVLDRPAAVLASALKALHHPTEGRQAPHHPAEATTVGALTKAAADIVAGAAAQAAQEDKKKKKSIQKQDRTAVPARSLSAARLQVFHAALTCVTLCSSVSLQPALREAVDLPPGVWRLSCVDNTVEYLRGAPGLSALETHVGAHESVVRLLRSLREPRDFHVLVLREEADEEDEAGHRALDLPRISTLSPALRVFSADMGAAPGAARPSLLADLGAHGGWRKLEHLHLNTPAAAPVYVDLFQMMRSWPRLRCAALGRLPCRNCAFVDWMEVGSLAELRRHLGGAHQETDDTCVMGSRLRCLGLTGASLAAGTLLQTYSSSSSSSSSSSPTAGRLSASGSDKPAPLFYSPTPPFSLSNLAHLEFKVHKAADFIDLGGLLHYSSPSLAALQLIGAPKRGEPPWLFEAQSALAALRLPSLRQLTLDFGPVEAVLPLLAGAPRLEKLGLSGSKSEALLLGLALAPHDATDNADSDDATDNNADNDGTIDNVNRDGATGNTDRSGVTEGRQALHPRTEGRQALHPLTEGRQALHPLTEGRQALHPLAGSADRDGGGGRDGHPRLHDHRGLKEVYVHLQGLTCPQRANLSCARSLLKLYLPAIKCIFVKDS